MQERRCRIVSGSVEEENGAGDGAYDLFNIKGTPDEIGKAIAESLKASDLYSGRCPSSIDAGHDLFLKITVKFGLAGNAAYQGERSEDDEDDEVVEAVPCE